MNAPARRMAKAVAFVAGALSIFGACAEPRAPVAEEGWVCLDRHRVGSYESSCFRTGLECTEALSGRDPGGAECEAPPTYTTCEVHATAACFTIVTDALSPRPVCAVSMAECEAVRGSLTVEALEAYLGRLLKPCGTTGGRLASRKPPKITRMEATACGLVAASASRSTLEGR